MTAPTEVDLMPLAPLARTIADTIRDTPVRLATMEGAADLVAALTVRVAAYVGSELPATPGVAQHMVDVDAERQRQLKRWGDQTHFDGTGRPGDVEEADRLRALCAANGPAEDNWRDILAEEVAEAFAETDQDRLRTELVQCAAVIAAWILNIDRRAGRAA
ncbi:NUDIX hydrolase [Streptomyces sp. NPDC005548]|uniref:NUDIX hydrolase n=1 Tax=Streptomyces sp. NPDC005548 TaxID=3364724 RepID=UPI0036B63800